MHLSEGRPQALELTGHWEKAAAALMPALKRENTKLKKENVSLRAKLLYRL